jgi:Ca2+-binding RTX toxin-like protein
MDGGAGIQQIVGGIGDDIMTGGADYDRFDFGTGWGHDVITDCNVAEDKIYLGGIPGLTNAAQLTVTSTADGAQIAFHDDTIALHGDLAASITAGMFVL